MHMNVYRIVCFELMSINLNSDLKWQKIPQSDPFGANSPNGTPLAQAPNFKHYLSHNVGFDVPNKSDKK
ncbi:MAG: hypothetical protein EA359_06645 [Balneolaceae bacterium]|nr:MAG: hypothetical protein EA359_06645 [Balneolaceae bacterium]